MNESQRNLAVGEIDRINREMQILVNGGTGIIESPENRESRQTKIKSLELERRGWEKRLTNDESTTHS